MKTREQGSKGAREQGSSGVEHILRAAGVPRPAWEARILEALGDGAVAAAERRAAGAPLAYAAGSAGFRLLELAVDQRVLIPRPETEGLVERVLAWQHARGPGGVVADVGTGSGCIALSLALEGRFDRVIGTDISPAALAVAVANGARLAPGRVEWRAGDLCAPLAGERLTALVANPPYVSEAEWRALEPGVRDQEPRLALVGGTDGLAHVRRLVEAARPLLLPGGLLAVEVDCTRAEAARTLAERAGWRDVRLEDDLFGRPRFVLASKE